MTRSLHYCEAVVKETEGDFNIILQFLCELVLRSHPITVLPGLSSSSEKLSVVSSTRGKLSQSIIMTRLCGIVDNAIDTLSAESEIRSHDHLWASLLCLSHCRCVSCAYTYIHTPAHTHAHSHMHKHMDTHTCTHTQTLIPPPTHMHTHTTYMHTHTQTHYTYLVRTSCNFVIKFL